MATHFKPHPQGTHYLFDKAGEGIAMHSHILPETGHYTRCLKGRCEIYGDMETLTLKAGEQGQFPSYRQHELVALEDGTEIVNVNLNGQPCEGSGSIAPVLVGRVHYG
jgi:quercetin dioxygenase-like cupin family protein